MSNNVPLKILGISGSLRSGSHNTALLRAAASLAPDSVEIKIYDGLRSIPPYDDDVRLAGFPEPVEDLREQIRRADALLFATPEYNRSFSGVLKNAIDWASRPPDQPFSGKPALVIGASVGMLGTAAANYQLRQVLSILNVLVVPGPEILVSLAAGKFDEKTTLTHTETGDALARALADLARFARRVSAH